MTHYLRPIGLIGILLVASLMFFPGMSDYRIPVLSLLLIGGVGGWAIDGYWTSRRAMRIEQREREMALEFLRMVNESSGTADLIHKAALFFKSHSGFDAVGIRMKEGEDFPYRETRGFPPEFVAQESLLCQCDSSNRLVRDEAGNPVLDCMCGNVICGRFDPGKPFFTAKGSFWTNSTSELLATTTEKDRQARTRNRCNGEGYESVALIPLRVGDAPMGLLQLNHRKKGMVTPQTLSFWERLADYLAVALSRSRIQEALMFSEESARSLFDNMLNGFAHCRMIYEEGKPVDFIYLNVNRAFSIQTGLKDVEGKPVSELIPGIRESNPEMLQLYGRVALTGKSEVFEPYLPMLKKWFHVTVYSPRAEHFVALFDDITERKQVEEKLRERGELFAKIFRHSPLLMSISDVESGCYFDVNEKFVEVSGFTREEAVGKSSIELGWISRSERDRISAQLKKGDSLVNMELSLTTKDKRSIQCTYAGATIIVDGHPFLLSLAEDITERKRADARLIESERRYDQLAELSRTFAWEVDSAGLFTYVSHVVESVLGYTPAELIGRLHFYDLHPEEGRDAFKAAALGFFRRKETFVNLVNTGLSKDGKRVWLLTNGCPLLDAQGTLLGYRGSDADVSENRRNEEERRKLQMQLVQAQKMESVGRLAGGVAHDFNNMLQVILGYVELAVEGTDSAQPLYSDLVEIRSAAKRSVALTQQLLAFARKQIIAPRVLDLDQTVGSMLSMLKRLIGEDIELVWTPGSGGATVRMDPSQLDQVLTNLVVNARAAIAGVGTITIECRPATVDAVDCAVNADAVPGDYVMLVVSDTGCGMDTATLEHLFEPFFTTKGIGTGLGLSTVYGIIKQNNGFVNVGSEPGQGTTFKLYLPRQTGVAEPSVTKSPVMPVALRREGILLVEDEQTLLTIAKKMLEGLGYRVLAAGTPDEALRLAAAHAPEINLLITDVVMPGLSGRDLAKRLAAVRPDLPCIFMSGYTANIIEERGVLARDLNFLPKPFTLNQLANMVRDVLSRAAKAGE